MTGRGQVIKAKNMSMLQAEQEARHAKLPGGDPRWSPRGIKGLVGVSGVYNCHDLADHLHSRGLYRSLFNRIMSKDGRSAHLSPSCALPLTSPHLLGIDASGMAADSTLYRSLWSLHDGGISTQFQAM